MKHDRTHLIMEIKLIENIMGTSNIPDEWRESVTFSIFKKVDKQLPQKYRGITNLLTIDFKLITRLLVKRL